MEKLKEQFPKTLEWIHSLQPFVIIRGEKHIIVKFSDGRESIELSYDKIIAFENKSDEEDFSWTH